MATDEQLDDERYYHRQPIDNPPQSITVSQQPLPLAYTQEHLVNRYTQWLQDITYFTDEGVCVCMVAAAPGATNPDGSDIKHEKVRYAKSITKIVITGTAEREDAKPSIPHWDLKNPDIICESHRQQFANPHRIMNSKQIHRAVWEYVYKVIKPITDTTILGLGTSPVENETSDQHKFDPANDMDDELNDMSWMQL